MFEENAAIYLITYYFSNISH